MQWSVVKMNKIRFMGTYAAMNYEKIIEGFSHIQNGLIREEPIMADRISIEMRSFKGKTNIVRKVTQ